MKIRRRVTQYILAVMTIVLVLLAAMVVSDVLENERRMQVARAKVAAGMIKNYIRQNSQMQTIYKSPVEPGHLPTDLALLADNMVESGWVGAILVIRDGEVYVSVPELSGDRQYDCEETFQNIEAKNVFEPGVDWRDSVNRSYSIHVRSLPVGSSIYESLTGVLGVFFVGTLLLLWTVFALLRRLVVSPIERLASAAETNRRARLPSLIDIGDPGTDEMRSLVAAFNAMLTELDDIKRNLEQRVQDETLARMRAQAGLIAEQRLAATGRLAAGVAHEINNPLAGLINAANMLETRIQSFNDARSKDYLSLMKEGLERIRAMVGELLAFARPTAETANVSIRDTFQSAFRLAEKTFLENRVDWELDIPDGLPTLVGKRNEFGQIALNLIINAAQATQGLPSPKVIVSARVEIAAVPAPGLRTDSGDGRRETADANRTMDVARQRLVIRVKDNGCGIPESIQDSIFDIFFTTRETQGGSGIGLAMTRHLVTTMGGHIAVESAVGQGSTFILSFPLPEAE